MGSTNQSGNPSSSTSKTTEGTTEEPEISTNPPETSPSKSTSKSGTVTSTTKGVTKTSEIKAQSICNLDDDEFAYLKNPLRRVNSKKNKNSSKRCDGQPESPKQGKVRNGDWEGPKWYRFNKSAGIKMLDSPPKYGSCGTERSGWLTGGHPEKTDKPEFKKVCFVGRNDNCKESTEIQVQNCGTYFMYKLVEMPHMCRVGAKKAYCGVREEN